MAKKTMKAISIAPEMLAEMSRFPDVNWSAVACRAFEIRLVELKSMNATTPTEKAIARLRASKMQATDSLYNAGQTAGTEYALKRAEYLELERLVDYWDNRHPEKEINIRQVADAMTDDAESVSDDIVGDLEKEHGTDIDREEWVEGFVMGALSAFEDIKKKI